MPNTSEVRVGAPDQKVTGAIKHAALGTAIPALSDVTKSAVTLDNAFSGNEYVSEDGLTLTPSKSTVDIKDWSGATVRKVLESFDGTLNWTMISTNAAALGIAFGEENIETAAATTTDGAKAKAALGAYLPDPQAWVFLMKDGDARIVIAVPNGQITDVGEITFASNAAVGWPVTLSTYPDEDGNSIYIMTNDGVVTA